MRHRDTPAGEITLATASAAETRRLGERCGSLLRTPLVICLIGDLGSGKTVFVQGLARGLDVSADYAVTSPSFTLINEYPGRLKLFHIDLYRLGTEADLDDLGLIGNSARRGGCGRGVGRQAYRWGGCRAPGDSL